VKRARGDRQPTRGFPPQIEGDRIDGLGIGEPVQGLQRDHRGHHISRRTGPAPTRREQIGEHRIREQFAPMRRQERKHAARLQKMPRYRLRIQQLTLTIRSTLHTEIIAKNHQQHADRHADYSGAL